jgi:hypothetical protein
MIACKAAGTLVNILHDTETHSVSPETSGAPEETTPSLQTFQITPATRCCSRHRGGLCRAGHLCRTEPSLSLCLLMFRIVPFRDGYGRSSCSSKFLQPKKFRETKTVGAKTTVRPQGIKFNSQSQTSEIGHSETLRLRKSLISPFSPLIRTTD